MLKILITACFVCTFLLSAIAQYAVKTPDPENPFKNARFLYSPTDTIMLTATYIGNGKLSNENLSMINSIGKIYRLNVKNFTYSLAFKLNGYSQNFYIPCKDKSFIHILSAKQSIINKLKIKCIVYRFFYIDCICNFFYIVKATLV